MSVVYWDTNNIHPAVFPSQPLFFDIIEQFFASSIIFIYQGLSSLGFNIPQKNPQIFHLILFLEVSMILLRQIYYETYLYAYICVYMHKHTGNIQHNIQLL